MANFWFAFDIGAYEDSTAHLTMLQDGAYNRLLRHYYKTGRPIPNNPDQIQRISGAHTEEEIEAVTGIIQTFFSLKSDGYHNKRADIEVVKAKLIIKLRKESGKIGGLAKARRLLVAKGVAKGLANEVAKPYTVTVTDTTTNTKSKAKAQSAFEIPDWIPNDKWEAYEEMRRKIRKPMTNTARSFAVRTLEQLRSHGQDVSSVLDQSVFNSWQGLFEVKFQQSKSNGKPQNAADIARKQLEEQRAATAGN